MIASALLRQTATIEPYMGESATGPLFGGPVAYSVRVRPKRHWMNTTRGEVSVSDALMDMRPDAVVAVKDRVSVGETVYRVMDVAEIMGLTRPEFIEATLSRSTT